ncbi:hypothetical protein BJ944DRAFT_158957 [Cunninghamella echinulata]|nr:hypothetical protein BJ944DRAFT_158957 [Cunninghamella echinulata]
MDSQYTHIHWKASNLPLLPEEWIKDKLPEEPIIVPEALKNTNEEDLELEIKKKPKKTIWRHHPMDK